MRSRPLTIGMVLTLAAGAALSCANPVHGDAVDALGGEVGGVGPGPRHRPGQPCLVCHGGDGPAPDFAIGGTIYATRAGPAPLPDVRVVLRDAAGVERTAVSNEVGNFWIPTGAWSPTYPVFVRLDYTALGKPAISAEMVTRIGGNGGCAFCHYGSDNETFHMPHVFMSDK